MLGEAYMDLVRHFAEEEGKSGGQFFTPPHIVNLCAQLVDDFEDGESFHDPTAGSGGMLIEAARHYREQGGAPSKLRFTGQEINPDIAAIASNCPTPACSRSPIDFKEIVRRGITNTDVTEAKDITDEISITGITDSV